jgi:hypothetical protein
MSGTDLPEYSIGSAITHGYRFGWSYHQIHAPRGFWTRTFEFGSTNIVVIRIRIVDGKVRVRFDTEHSTYRGKRILKDRVLNFDLQKPSTSYHNVIWNFNLGDPECIDNVRVLLAHVVGNLDEITKEEKKRIADLNAKRRGLR